MRKKKNFYTYNTTTGYVTGAFNLYQGRNGKIILVMGNTYTELTLQQINDLSIHLYSLQDFDNDLYAKGYSDLPQG